MDLGVVHFIHKQLISIVTDVIKRPTFFSKPELYASRPVAVYTALNTTG